MGLLATLTRSTGLMLLFPLALLWWEQRRGCAIRLPGGPGRLMCAAPRRSGRWRVGRSQRPSWASSAWLLLVPSGLGLYMAYLWTQFRNPFEFDLVQGNWGRRLELPFTTLWHGAVDFVVAIYSFAAHGLANVLVHTPSGGLNSDSVANFLEFLALIAAVLALVACWRRLPSAYTVYAVAALLFPLLYPTAARPLSSLPRFLVVIFPLFMGTSGVLATHRVWRWVLVALMVPFLLLATVCFANFT